MGSSRAERTLVVGISSNVVDPAMRVGGLDGIGVYTQALERSLIAEGVITRRVGAPVAKRSGWRRPGCADVAFGAPLASTIAWSMLTGRPTPLAAQVEGAVDVYHCTDYLVPRLRRTPVVATIYDAIPLLHPEWANQRLRSIKNRLLRGAAGAANLVIAVSDAAVPEIIGAYGVPREIIRVVPPGVEEAWFASSPQIAALSSGTDRILSGCFLFVGTLQPRKNVATLLAAYDALPSAIRSSRQLVVVGKYGWGADDVRSQLLERRAAGRVLWLRHVDDATLRTLHGNAGALVFPSRAEGFGLPVLEALASGLPVVCSDLPVLREVAGDCATFVPPDDVDGLAAAMVASVEDRGSSARERRRDRARKFDWRSTALRTIAVYREALARHKE